MNNPIIPNNANVGLLAAETDDDYLFSCYVDHPARTELLDPSSPSMILLGGTGVGKTAILRIIERDEERIHKIELDELSLTYITNSDVLRFLATIEVPLDHFFQALWRHIICLEYIKLKYRSEKGGNSSGIWASISQRFRPDITKAKALQYLERWQDRFWITVDENVREIVNRLESDVTAAVGSDINRFRTDAGWSRKLSEDRKIHLQSRVRRFVDADLLSELAHVIRLLGDLDVDKQVTHYIQIDDLDENWVHSDTRYRIIRSLIEALKSMRKIRDLKIIVSMRADLLEKVLLETQERGFQAEKYEDYTYRLQWTSEQLKEILDKRVAQMFRRRYTNAIVSFDDIFSVKVGQEAPFSYIISRTFLRPRDIISFVNLILREAHGKQVVTQTCILEAERVYSEDRLNALVDEWRSVYPAIEPTLRLLQGKRPSFPLSELNTQGVQNDLLNLFFSDAACEEDPIYSIIDSMAKTGGDSQYFALLVEIIERLHLIGAIGINPGPTQPLHWFHKNNRRLSRGAISIESKVSIHPMLHRALGISGGRPSVRPRRQD